MYVDEASVLRAVADTREHRLVGDAPGPHEAGAVVDTVPGPEELPPTLATSAPDLVGLVPPAWDAATVYTMADRVAHGGAVFEAAWRTRGQVPGASPCGPWQEITTGADGTAAWTRSRIFEPGDVVVHDGVRYVAHWWTRDQEPGDPHGPWCAQR